MIIFFFKQKTAYEMRISDWSSDVCSSDLNIAINLYVVSRYGIVGLAGATAVSASLNCLLLYAMLHRRGWFRFTGKLALRVGRQLVAVAAMAALLRWMMPRPADHYGGPGFERIWSPAALVRAGGGAGARRVGEGEVSTCEF